MLLRRQAPRGPPQTDRSRAPRLLWASIVAGGLAVRVFMIRGAPLGEYELDCFAMVHGEDFLAFLDLCETPCTGAAGWGFHAPLPLSAFTLWLRLGEAWDVADLLLWLRLPNLVLAAFAFRILARLGRAASSRAPRTLSLGAGCGGRQGADAREGAAQLARQPRARRTCGVARRRP